MSEYQLVTALFCMPFLIVGLAHNIGATLLARTKAKVARRQEQRR